MSVYDSNACSGSIVRYDNVHAYVHVHDNACINEESSLHILRSSFEFLISSPSPDTQDPMMSHILRGSGWFGEDGVLE